MLKLLVLVFPYISPWPLVNCGFCAVFVCIGNLWEMYCSDIPYQKYWLDFSQSYICYNHIYYDLHKMWWYSIQSFTSNSPKGQMISYVKITKTWFLQLYPAHHVMQKVSLAQIPLQSPTPYRDMRRAPMESSSYISATWTTISPVETPQIECSASWIRWGGVINRNHVNVGYIVS